MDELEKVLSRLPLWNRVAFAAGCAQRAHTVYKFTVPGPVIFRGFAVAIDTAWAFAESQAIDAARLENAKAEVSRAFPEPDLGGGANHYSCAAAAYALDAVEDKTGRSAYLASGRVLDAIAQIDDEGGVQEEEEWQKRVLDVAKNWGNKPILRNMFDAVEPQKPEWLVRFTS